MSSSFFPQSLITALSSPSPLLPVANGFRLSQVICEKVEKSDIATIDKKKYLVPADLTVGQFVYVIRKRIKLSPEKAIFIFVDEVLPPTAALMSSIYEEHKDEDGFLYITYGSPSPFRSAAILSSRDSSTHENTELTTRPLDTLARIPLATFKGHASLFCSPYNSTLFRPS